MNLNELLADAQSNTESLLQKRADLQVQSQSIMTEMQKIDVQLLRLDGKIELLNQFVKDYHIQEVSNLRVE